MKTRFVEMLAGQMLEIRVHLASPVSECQNLSRNGYHQRKAFQSIVMEKLSINNQSFWIFCAAKKVSFPQKKHHRIVRNTTEL